MTAMAAVDRCSFLVTKQTSALTLQVLGNAKGVLGAGISVALFRNPVTLNGCVGYSLTVGGVICYSQVPDTLQCWLPRAADFSRSHACAGQADDTGAENASVAVAAKAQPLPLVHGCRLAGALQQMMAADLVWTYLTVASLCMIRPLSTLKGQQSSSDARLHVGSS